MRTLRMKKKPTKVIVSKNWSRINHNVPQPKWISIFLIIKFFKKNYFFFIRFQVLTLKIWSPLMILKKGFSPSNVRIRVLKYRAYPAIALYYWFWPTTVAPLLMLCAVWLTNICDLCRRPVLWFVRQTDGVICVVDQFCDSPKPNFVHYVTWPPLQWCQVIMFPNSSSHKGFWVSDFYYEIEGANVQFYCGLQQN